MLDRQYVIPLRKALRAPRTKRAPKAVKLVREFLLRHMKGDDVKLGASVNEALWKDGIKNVLPRIKVHAVRDDKNVIRCELPGVGIRTAEEEKKVREAREKEKKEVAEKKAKAVTGIEEAKKDGAGNKEEKETSAPHKEKKQ